MWRFLLACDGAKDPRCDATNEDCDPDTCAEAPNGPEMLPGADCLACHAEGRLPTGDQPDRWWTTAGTVFAAPEGGDGAQGVVVRITDIEGRTLVLGTNAAGNFYALDPLVPPYTAEIEGPGGTRTMVERPTDPSCNACHACGGSAGKLVAP